MHVISRKRLSQFAEQHPEAKASLAHWYQLMKRRDFANFVDLRTVFSAADQVGKLTVFNVGGNKVRLIAAIHYIVARFTFAQCLLTVNTTSSAGRNK